MIELRQSTAGQEIPIGQALDSTDGDTEEGGLTIANTDIKIWKWGTTTLASKNSGGGTYISNGVYYLVLDATDSNTLGPMVIFVHVAGALAMKVECAVLTANQWDSKYSTDKLQVDTVEVSGTTQTANDNGADINNILLDTDELQTNQGNWLTATGFSTHSAADIWAVTTRTLSSYGTLVADMAAAVWATAVKIVTSITNAVVTDAASRTASKADVSALALASVVTEARLAELDAANLPADISAIPTVMRGTDNAALASDLVTHNNNLAIVDGKIDLIPTTAMRGTDGANTTVPDAAGTAATLHGITDGKIDTMQIDVTEILDYEAGDWEITNNQMIFKTKAGATLATYNLTKAAVPDSDSPDKREKV